MTDVGEIPLTIESGWNEIKEIKGNYLASPVLQPVEERVILPDRATDAVPEVMLVVASFGRARDVKIVVRIEGFVARELPHRAMKGVCARLGFDFDRARSAFSVLSAVVGGQDLNFCNGLDAGIHVQRKIAAVVHHVAAIDFPVVIFGAASIHAVADVARSADHALILTSLIAYARHQRYELGEVAAIELKLEQLSSCDGPT